MDARDTTANNADLWSHYLRGEWNRFLDPFHLADPAAVDAAARTIADVAAANIATVLSALMALPVARMYESNDAEVTHSMQLAQLAVEEHVVIPEPYMARSPCPDVDATQVFDPTPVSSPARETVVAY
jgi:hypothetical protein